MFLRRLYKGYEIEMGYGKVGEIFSGRGRKIEKCEKKDKDMKICWSMSH